jgi:hypothetical protein
MMQYRRRFFEPRQIIVPVRLNSTYLPLYETTNFHHAFMQLPDRPTYPSQNYNLKMWRKNRVQCTLTNKIAEKKIYSLCKG